MVFQERKKKDGYIYDVHDLFGHVNIESSNKLEADILDEIVMILLKQKTGVKTIIGEISHNEDAIKYTFKKADLWTDDEDEKTSTESVPEQSEQLGGVFYRCHRFVNAFRKAWKDQK